MAMGETAISIVIPVYNGEKYLEECLKSCLEQDFNLPYEIIVVDDGSTDNTLRILDSYKELLNIYYKPHSNIADTLNIGIGAAQGKYIVRMDADDIMYPNRLKVQYDYMENHPDVDIAGFGFEWGNGKKNKEYFTPKDIVVTKQTLIQGNPMGHPTVIMRRESLFKLPFLYENYYKCEDYRLWVLALEYNLKVSTCSIPVIKYRQHSEQLVNKNYSAINDSAGMIKRLLTYKNSGELTCIITFKNETVEVEKTLASIRATAHNVKIIVVDDNSDDGWDYKSIVEGYGAMYIRNNKRCGCAGSRQIGTAACTTPYFVILDCHMRFYHMDWDITLLKYLKENPGCIITSNTVYISKKDGFYINEDGAAGKDSIGYGAYVNMQESGWELTAKWANKFIESSNERLVPIPCVLGAVYASSIEHWNNIKGVEGIEIYGSDEPLMSIKTWLSGGKCLIIKDWGVGHLYRSSSPFATDTSYVDRNQLYCIHLFCTDEDIAKYENNLKARIGELSFTRAKEMLMCDYDDLVKMKEYLHTKVFKYPFSYFEELNRKVFS